MSARVWQRVRGASRRLTEGFTLVELMVAVTGGLFVSIAVFMLAKQSTSLYQSEARMGNATLGSVAGFERLRIDIARAGFMASPNLKRDAKLCPIPDATWPAYLARLSSVFIEPTPTSLVPAVLKDNGIQPDEITLAGSYASPDQFQTASIDNMSGANHVVVLDTKQGPMARLGYDKVTTSAEQQALMLSVFGRGRGLRIVDQVGREQYGTIADVQGGSSPSILLEQSKPPILYRATSSALKCGVEGVGRMHLVNVVNIVKYSLRNLASIARYAPIYGTTGPVTDTGRTELVREELDTTGATIAGTEEIVAEFAVDLRFGITVNDSPDLTPIGQQLRSLPPGDPAVLDWAGNPATLNLTTHGPQRIRAVRARLSVRSREADRPTGMPTLGDGGLPVAQGLYRIGVGPGGKAPFARVRTTQAEIALRNQRGISWL